jgi:hypothetical protein
MIEKTIDADGTAHVSMSLEMVSVTLPAVELKRISDETERLRALIRAVVQQRAAWRDKPPCPCCLTRGVHYSGCTWPALVAEAEKP